MVDRDDLKHRIINELQHMMNLSEDAALGLDVTQKIRASIEQIALDVRRL